jgi:hypothetical protein
MYYRLKSHLATLLLKVSEGSKLVSVSTDTYITL